MKFEDSNILYVNQIDFFKVALGYFLLIKQLFVKKIFSWTCKMRAKK